MTVRDLVLKLSDMPADSEVFAMDRELDNLVTIVREATPEECTTGNWLDAGGNIHRGLPEAAVLIC